MSIQTCELCGHQAIIAGMARTCPNCRASVADQAKAAAAKAAAAAKSATPLPPPPRQPGSAPPPPPGFGSKFAAANSAVPHTGTANRSTWGGDRNFVMILGASVLGVVLILALGLPMIMSGVNRKSRTASAEKPSDGVRTVPATTPVPSAPLANRQSLASEMVPKKYGATLDRAELTELVDRSIVLFEVKRTDGEFIGSGFVVDRFGTVMTNHHVVKDATTIVARFNDNSSADSVRVIYSNAALDLALVRITKAKGLPRPLPLASVEPKKGEDIAAFGSPGGMSFTTSFGNVSALRKAGSSRVIQFTAPISPGNSGGPIVNMHGEVVGMSSFMLAMKDAQNLNFALSIVDILASLEQQRANGTIPR